LNKVLLKQFPEAANPVSESKSLEIKFGIMDPANVMMIIPKTNRAKVILRRYIEEDYNPVTNKIPDLSYKTKGIISVKVSCDYMKYIFAFLEIYNKINNTGSVIIHAKKDFPISLENEDFRFILAPRVDAE
jgi:hypothetical protein